MASEEIKSGNQNKVIHFHVSQMLHSKNPCFFKVELNFPYQTISFQFSSVSSKTSIFLAFLNLSITFISITQLAITCSKLKIETLEQRVK